MTRGTGPQQWPPSGNPFLTLQQTLGNQAMLQLLEAGIVQAKLRVSQPGDADEIEADRIAEKIVASPSAPTLHRKCSCAAGTSCPKCEEEQQGVLHRSVATPLLRSSGDIVQRSPGDAASGPTQADATPQTTPPSARGTARPAQFVVEDDAKSIEPHQMRKSQFIALLRADACVAADAILASVGHTTKSCPYITKWLGFYEKQSSGHIERTIRKYAPETATARSAHEAISLVVKRVQRATLTWAKTGKIEGLPEEVAREVGGQGSFLGAVQSVASSKVGGAILGFIGGTDKKGDSGPSSVSRKARGEAAAPAHDAVAVKAQLGSGHSLDSRVQSQMSSALGHDFSGVRVHTDSHAATLSSDLQARAFTVGNDVAFASGEYQPGTLVGDALIAHELAHVVQQDGGQRSSLPMPKSAEGSNQLEDEADRSAVGAVLLGWAGAKKGLLESTQRVMPRLRSGLRLQACKNGDGPTFTVVGHGVSDSTVKMARERMTEILGILKDPNVSALGKVAVELHLIPANKKLTDLPEYSHLKGVRTFDGRLYDNLRGAGGEKVGNTIRYAVAEEQLVAVAGHPSGYAQGFVAGHETGHIVEQYSLTKEQNTELHKLFGERTKAGGPWLAPAAYTQSNFEEYFAQGVAAYFGHPYTEADKNMYTREWLKTNDPGLHALLAKIFR